MKFQEDFKKELLALPVKEKDRLLLRLLKKDLDLANKLYYELLDDTSVEEYRDQLEQHIKNRITFHTAKFWSPGYLMMELRDLSGEITNHVKIRKDKFGEIYLNLIMLTETLQQNMENLKKATASKRKKFDIYVIARCFKILLLVKKLHEDYLLDFEELLISLGNSLGKDDSLMKAAIYHGFNVNWLIQLEIPDDIADIHKDLRARGYLK
ncbi:hypothetical protein NBT05_08955 [Aquimarina sp. ERC-38]|uniref:hypothetical protein n=1 Tax=Aquimarina sp. ERC-38 TaxID=2949996 RepID=UPI002246C7DE|nr:hypothetical protein [Aquimarina sp. ERC-38]UZO82590.1 hypothetical protein NBT05_08955 [Aquimarina sp. ERC-38]